MRLAALRTADAGAPGVVFREAVLAMSGPGHVSEALDGGPSGGDWTGILYALAGLVLIGLAVVFAAASFRGRGAPAARSGSA